MRIAAIRLGAGFLAEKLIHFIEAGEVADEAIAASCGAAAKLREVSRFK